MSTQNIQRTYIHTFKSALWGDIQGQNALMSTIKFPTSPSDGIGMGQLQLMFKNIAEEHTSAKARHDHQVACTLTRPLLIEFLNSHSQEAGNRTVAHRDDHHHVMHHPDGSKQTETARILDDSKISLVREFIEKQKVKDKQIRVTSVIQDHLDEFQGISDIKLFTDKGPHFDNYEVADLFLCHLPQKLNCCLSWHLWAAKHGKSEVDGHFGLLSRFYNEQTKKTRIDIMEQFIPEMQSAIEKDHLMKNAFILKYPAHLEVPETPKSVSFLKFSGITDHHCFLSNPGSSQIILKTTSAESCPGHIITKVVGTRSNTHQIKLSYSKRTAEQSMEEEQGTEYSPRLQKQARRQHQSWSRRPQLEPPPQPP
ncbi:hypothetical protein Pelo_13160 [Pelomyxa schiedti]|nr:hypothetical protein Pelo_13160 [Pelomyxa schiedti]